MGNLKIGKQPKRMGKPSAKFLEKKALEEQSRRKASVVADIDLAVSRHTELGLISDKVYTPHRDDVAIYLDDERPVPEGWLLARTSKEFFELLERDDDFLNRVTHLSLDWYLGERDINGVQVAQRLADKFLEAYYDDRVFLPRLREIGCHSSDRDQAGKMARELEEALNYGESERSVRVRLRTPFFC